MKTAAESDNWRQKYFDSLGRLENDQARFKAMEATLRRLTGRLCTAALGQSTQLDEQIKKLQSAIRRDAGIEDLEKITPALTQAIQGLDRPSDASDIASVPASSAPAVGVGVADERIRAIIAALLAEIRRDAQLADKVDALDGRLAAAIAPAQLPDVLSSVADLVAQRIQSIERAKQEVEALLSHMVGKLDEIGEFVAQQNNSQRESQASSETLNVQLAGEMKAMGESVEAASDLQQIRLQVRDRLDSIDRHLQQFRQREAALATAMRERSEQMHSRIAELEAEASRLHRELRIEQRLSLIDPLTKVPNRLAFQKRMDEELKRCQRFDQPACLVVWDVDHFKRVNDTYGHRAGDRVLQAVAESLGGRIRGTDFLARYGGEEFVLILPGTSLSDALHLVDQMRIAVAAIGFHFRGTPVSITISAGATALKRDDSPEVAFDRADKALYRAKENGRNRCVSL